MSPSRSFRDSPDPFSFEGTDDAARVWLDAAYGTRLRLEGDLGTVRHDVVDHGDVAFNHVRIDARYSFDSDPMPTLTIADVLSGTIEYVRDEVADRARDGDSLLVAGWDTPFTGSADHPQVRSTSLSRDAMLEAVAEADPKHPRRHIIFTSYRPRTPAAGARWRATVDQVGAMLPHDASAGQERAAARLLGHTLLHTFANNIVVRPVLPGVAVDEVDDSTSTVRRAARIIEDHASEDLTPGALARECGVSPRALQYAFRHHLGCTPQDYLRRVRLDLARQAMRDGSAESVSDAAARNGFFNPGRFATYYREQYAENPGDTWSRTTPSDGP